MSEDAPVNTGAVEWPSVDSAYFAVRRMQTKLHRWAGDDASRRFGDLFNLVYDPAFLMHAWERVSTNTGARTAGIDKATAAWVETWVGVEAFLGQIRDSLKSGEFTPVEVRQVMIPKGTTGKFRKLGIPLALITELTALTAWVADYHADRGPHCPPPSLTGWSRPA
ncbi:MAG: hypothetical protein WAL99_20605 [Pseudonocardiaceae bacterium]